MPIIRVLYIILGTISLILGILGIFLPLLPTTPFLLLTAFLYMRSSTRCYNWLMNQKYLGSYIRNYSEHKVIPLRAKIITLILLWGSIIYCAGFIVPNLIVKILLILIAIGVTWHVLSFKSK